MFDSVCSGLAACLALVHSDIRQMTEHRNRLAQLEQELIYAKLKPTEDLEAEVNIELRSAIQRKQNSNQINNNTNINNNICDHQQNAKWRPISGKTRQDFDAAITNAKNAIATGAIKSELGAKQRYELDKDDDHHHHHLGGDDVNDDDDPHHLSKLKMLDKRLADSLSHALSMSDLQKSSWNAKQQTSGSGSGSGGRGFGNNRTSIFSVLLGRSGSSSSSSSSSNSMTTGRLLGRRKSNQLKVNKVVEEEAGGQMDNKTIIDDINRQTRLAMQYSKQLETNLFKVEELRSRYEMHLKMGLVASRGSGVCGGGDGRHYCDSGSLSRSSVNLSASHSFLRRNRSSYSKSSLNHHLIGSTKTTIKEFIENIDKIETEFESYTGSFLLAIEDIQGFARVCQGDVFEITIKYGETQKFKTKISVLKDNKQKCDNRQTVFKARIADVLAIKAYECKGLGKRTLLGHKLCETRDLFTARSQLMTISLNQTGSIKLNMIVTWNPLHTMHINPT